VKQREGQIEEKFGENFGLKQTIDQMRMEREKIKKQFENLEDMNR